MGTFSEIFQRTHGAPIEVDGRIIQPVFQVKIDGVRKTFVIRRLKSRSASVAGLRIKAEKGEIEVHVTNDIQKLFCGLTLVLNPFRCQCCRKPGVS